jgi:hypothetical protein
MSDYHIFKLTIKVLKITETSKYFTIKITPEHTPL